MNNNITVITTPKPKYNAENFVEITYNDNSIEVIKCDFFGLSEELPGFLALWSDESDTSLGFIRVETIKKINIINKGIDDNS